MALETRAQSAIDFHGLNQLRAGAIASDKTAQQQTLRQVSAQFESLFITMMLKSMRQASLGEGIFDSSQSEMYRELADQQLASDLSARGGMGLQEVIMRQLGGQVGESAQLKTGQAYSIDTVTIRPALGAKINARIIEQIVESRPLVDEPVARVISGEPQQFDSPRDFVEKLWPLAKSAADKLGVAPEVILSQAALETGWGRHVLNTADGGSSFNLFNIKAGQSWAGETATLNALEYRQGRAFNEVSHFRAYDSYQQSFDDYVRFLQTQPRYREALQHVHDAEAFIEQLHKAGYATDPQYADKIKRIMNGDTLARAEAFNYS